MIQLHPEFLTKNGQKEFAVLPYAEHVALQEWLNDAADLLDLRRAKAEAADGKPVPLEAVKKALGID